MVRAAHPARESRRHDRVIQAPGSELQAGLEVLWLEIRQFLNNLLSTQAGCEQVEHVRHPNPHPTNAGPSTTLLRVGRDPILPVHRSSFYSGDGLSRRHDRANLI